jgi:hypothetical protein
MGQVSTLEDIQERIDDALVRLPSPPDVKRGSISRESLRDTNDLLRSRNDELLKLLYAVKMDIESKINQPFCKAECVKLRETNDWLRRRLETHRNDKGPPNPTFKDKAPASHQPERTELVAPNLREEAKRRYHDAEKVVAAAKQALKEAEKARATAQNEFQALHQSERNSTKYVHDTGHGRQ